MDDETAVPTKTISRRRIVVGAVGAAAVGAAAATAAPAVAHAVTGHKSTPAADTGSLPKQDWVIYVRDASESSMDVFVGMQHFAVNDHDLIARLIAAVTA